jgi:anti-sigma factor (TIGR02949 family)
MRQLFDYLDGELTGERMAAVRDHARACRSCYPHYDFEKLLLETLGELREKSPAPGELRARVMAALEKDGLGRSQVG